MDLLISGAAELGLHLTDHQVKRFHRYYQELISWNQQLNLTTIVAYPEVQTKHFLDSLTASLVLPADIKEAGRIIDIGAGAGFPGLPLKIAYPGLHLALLESVGKKSAFLAHLVDILELSRVEVHTGRAETLAFDPSLRESFDVVLARAVGPLPSLAELTLPFCRLGGVAVAFKKGKVEQEVQASLSALAILGGHLKERKSVEVKGLKDGRLLVVVEKVKPTPEQYPRRPGMPRKRPL